jgi:hypothetical protein
VGVMWVQPTVGRCGGGILAVGGHGGSATEHKELEEARHANEGRAVPI